MRSWIDRHLTARNLGAVLLVSVVFLCSRGLLAVSATQYPGETDVEIAYRLWATEIIDDGETPYSEIEIEYPPASLPFVLGPHLASTDESGYRNTFVLLLMVIDIIGFLVLMLLARRNGSLLGPWIWTIAIFVLGPVAYLRLDLIPAVATIGVVARADRDDWLGTGAFLGFAVAAKAYAVVLLPILYLMCPAERRKRLLLGVGGTIALSLVPFLFVLPAMFTEVVGYHGSRGIQIESLWGSLLFILRKADQYIVIRHNFGAHHFEGGTVPLLKAIATGATLVVVGVGAWIAGRLPRNTSELTGTMFATITLVLAVASVFSPQFMIWVIALGACAVSFSDSRLQGHALLLIVVAGVTRLVYPVLHVGLVRAESLPIGVVWFRNLLILMLGMYAAVRQLEGATDPSKPERASVGTP